MPTTPLVEVLHRLTEVHRELLTLAEQKRQALISNTLNDIMSASNKESKLLKQVTDLQQEQKRAAEAFFQAKGYMLTREVTVTELSRLVSDPEKKRQLIDARDLLIETIAELKKRNDLNQQLIAQSLAFINYSIDVIAGPPEDDPIYQSPVQRQGNASGRAGLFDWKA